MINFLNTSNNANLVTWKKDINSVFLDANENCTNLFGFKKPEDVLGLTDYELPCKLSDFADCFRTNDKLVIEREKTLKTLEIQPCANDVWKILLVTKEPLYSVTKQVCGTQAFTIDITDFFKKIPNLIDNFLMTTSRLTNGSIFSTLMKDEVKLSKRESECLFFLMRGKTIKEIAQILKLSNRTVEHYIDIIKTKLNCNNKSDLIDKAYKLGFSNIIPDSIFKTQVSIVIE